jgi:alkylated DNA repair dioxygenase AlkB
MNVVARRKDSPIEELPEGLVYRPEFLSVVEEKELLATIETLTFRAFEFQGYTAKRRVVEYGWEYDFSSRKAAEANPIPEYLAPLRRRVAQFAAIPEQKLVEAIITEYPAGAPIGWHRDVPQFEDVIGISLRSSCRMRLKPYKGIGKLVSVRLEPRSIYLLQGPARWEFQHSIPAVDDLRYSITFRSLRKKPGKREAA